jgi:hypothetical protein
VVEDLCKNRIKPSLFAVAHYVIIALILLLPIESNLNQQNIDNVEDKFIVELE